MFLYPIFGKSGRLREASISLQVFCRCATLDHRYWSSKFMSWCYTAANDTESVCLLHLTALYFSITVPYSIKSKELNKNKEIKPHHNKRLHPWYAKRQMQFITILNNYFLMKALNAKLTNISLFVWSFFPRQLTSFINITLNVPDVKSAIKSNKRTTFRAITGETKRNKDKKLKRTEQRKTHFWYKQQIVDTVEQEYCTSIIFNAKIVKAKGEHLHCRVFLGLKWVFRGDSAGKHSCYFLPFDKQIYILNWSKWNHSFPLRSIQNLFYPRTSTSSNPCFSFLIWVVFVTL